MSLELAPLAAALARCDMTIDDPRAAEVLRLLRVVSAEVRTRTKRPFDDVPTVYDQLIDTDGMSFTLPAVPVSDLLSIAAAHWDGTEDDIYGPEPVLGGLATTLAVAAAVGATNLKVVSVAGLLAGDHLSLGTEVVRVTAVGTAGAMGTGVTIEPATTLLHALGAAVTEVRGSTYWRLVDAARGRVERNGGWRDDWDEWDAYGTRFVRVRWRVAGTVPVEVTNAVIEWTASRWGNREWAAGQSSYSTGSDSESRDITKAGHPPPDVARVLLAYWHPTRSGVV